MSRWRGLADAMWPTPTGRSTAARLALTAGEVGFDAVVLRDTSEMGPPPAAIAEQSGVDLIHGFELTGDDADAISGQLPHLRQQTTMLMVAGGSESLNRFIADQPHVDVLTTPIGPDGPDLDPGIAKSAREHDVALEVDLGPLRRTAGGERVRYIDRLQRLWRLIDHYEVPYVLTMSPSSHLDVVAPREVAALAERIGIEQAEAQAGLGAWTTIARRNREDHDAGFFGPDALPASDEANDR